MIFDYIIESLIVILFISLFIKKEKAKIKFLYFAILFFLVSTIIQTPFILLEKKIVNLNLIINSDIAIFLIILLKSTINEFIKYFSLKKRLKTRSIRNALLFGLTWTSLESLSFIREAIFYISNLIFPSLKISIFHTQIPIYDFFILFVINSIISFYVILSVVRRKKIFFVIGLLYTYSFSYYLFFLRNLLQNYSYFVDLFIFIIFIYLIFKAKKTGRY